MNEIESLQSRHLKALNRLGNMLRLELDLWLELYFGENTPEMMERIHQLKISVLAEIDEYQNSCGALEHQSANAAQFLAASD